MGDCCGNVCAGSAANATNFHSTGTTGQIPPGDYGNLHAQYDAIMADGNNHGFTSFDDFKAKAADAIAAAERAGILKGDTAFDKLQSLGDAFWQHAGPNGIFSFDADQNDVASMMADYGLSRQQVNSLKFLLDTAGANGRTDAELHQDEMQQLHRTPVTDDIEKMMNYAPA